MEHTPKCPGVHGEAFGLGAVQGRWQPVAGGLQSDGQMLAGFIWVYSDPKQSPNEGFCKAGVQTEAGVTKAKWVSERGILVASDSGAVELWELAEDDSLLVNRFTKLEHDHIVTSVSPAGSNHAVSSSMDCRIKVWDLSQGEVVSTHNAHSKPVTCVSCNPSDDSLFLSCGQDGRLLLWDRRKPTKPASRLEVEPSCCPTSVAWHPHHRTTIAYSDELGPVTLKDFQGTEPAQMQSTHSRRVSSLAFSSHSAPLLASISDDCSRSSTISRDRTDPPLETPRPHRRPTTQPGSGDRGRVVVEVWGFVGGGGEFEWLA
ncbi:unnamed protein product [Coregonus sp. 'balchen']|nr:unnamed protein product [Coregonus sp. 'balchen']